MGCGISDLGPGYRAVDQRHDAVDGKTVKKRLTEHGKNDQFVQLVEVDGRVTFVSRRKTA